MSAFDAEVFARLVLAPAGSLLTGSPDATAPARSKLVQLREDIEATLAAIEVEHNSRRARALKDDLEQFLPVRAKEVVDACQHMTVGDAERVSLALSIAHGAVLVTARSFVCGGA